MARAAPSPRSAWLQLGAPLTCTTCACYKKELRPQLRSATHICLGVAADAERRVKTDARPHTESPPAPRTYVKLDGVYLKTSSTNSLHEPVNWICFMLVCLERNLGFWGGGVLLFHWRFLEARANRMITNIMMESNLGEKSPVC